MSNVRSITDSDFDEAVLHSERPVLVDFWAEWCGPCRAVGPILDAMAADHAQKMDIVKVNIDESPNATARYGVSSIPALLVFQGGEVVERIIGAKPRTLLERQLAGYLA